jgi:hypothetical protein
MRDGSFISGRLAWYNTDVVEVEDRDLVFVPPIKIKMQGAEEDSAFSRMVISARDIVRLNVSYIASGPI